METDYKRLDKKEKELRLMCQRYIDREITFGVLFDYLKRNKIIKKKLKKRLEK